MNLLDLLNYKCLQNFAHRRLLPFLKPDGFWKSCITVT